MKKARTRRRAVPAYPAMRIDLAGDWRQFTPTVPKGCEILGTLTIGESDTGALVKLATTGA